jgi:hypothetical protein
VPEQESAIPNHAFTIWFTCKERTPSPSRPMPPEYLWNIVDFQRYNPNFSYTIITDDHRSIRQSIEALHTSGRPVQPDFEEMSSDLQTMSVSGDAAGSLRRGMSPGGVQRSRLPLSQVKVVDWHDFFESSWGDFPQHKKDVLYNAIAGERTGYTPLRSPHSASDLMRIVGQKLEPGYYFDGDVRFFQRPLPQLTAPYGIRLAAFEGVESFENGVIACTPGAPIVDDILTRMAHLYDGTSKPVLAELDEGAHKAPQQHGWLFRDHKRAPGEDRSSLSTELNGLIAEALEERFPKLGDVFCNLLPKELAISNQYWISTVTDGAWEVPPGFPPSLRPRASISTDRASYPPGLSYPPRKISPPQGSAPSSSDGYAALQASQLPWPSQLRTEDQAILQKANRSEKPYDPNYAATSPPRLHPAASNSRAGR